MYLPRLNSSSAHIEGCFSLGTISEDLERVWQWGSVLLVSYATHGIPWPWTEKLTNRPDIQGRKSTETYVDLAQEIEVKRLIHDMEEYWGRRGYCLLLIDDNYECAVVVFFFILQVLKWFLLCVFLDPWNAHVVWCICAWLVFCSVSRWGWLRSPWWNSLYFNVTECEVIYFFKVQWHLLEYARYLILRRSFDIYRMSEITGRCVWI